MTGTSTGPVRVGAVLAEESAASVGRWVLLGSEGLWCADCLIPGCGWTTTTNHSDTATTAAIVHSLTHPHTTDETATRTTAGTSIEGRAS